MSPYPINQSFRDEKDKKENEPIFLYEVEIGQEALLRFAEYDQDIIYNGQTYLRFPLRHEPIRTQINGEIDAVKVTLSNITREIGATIIEYDGLRGKRVTIRLVFANLLHDPNANISETFYIDGCEVTEETATFILTSKLDVHEVQLPSRMFERDFCQWEYKKEGCWLWSGSSWTAPQGFLNQDVECDKLLNSPNGCIFHNNRKRFGGFPAIPSRGLYVI